MILILHYCNKRKINIFMVEVLGYACKIKGHHTIHCPLVRVKGDPTDIPRSNRNGHHVSMDGGGGAPVRPSCVQAA